MNILLGVSGGIAAYKAVELASSLVKSGNSVDVIMTKNCTNFISPLTFRSIVKKRVIVDMFDEPEFMEIKHISLAQKSDLIVVAPATANIIGKVANGIADDMLSTTIMASNCKVMFVPAMNNIMYENKIVRDNINKLKNLGYIFIEPEIGMMACGTSGKGRYPENKVILDTIENILKEKLEYNKQDMSNIKVLLTAGPTVESIDPVRYITNKSSGKMGYSIARRAFERGANVKIISGPVNLEKISGIEIEDVKTADEMLKAVMESYQDYDILIMVAAVADYKCKEVAYQKIKKSENEMSLVLIKNPDIAKEIGKIKGDKIFVGFCAETDDLINNAKLKVNAKNFDFIVANDVTKEGAGFSVDTNIISIIDKNGKIINYDKMLKSDVANIILDYSMKLYNEK